jgi:hypothetical protein
MQQSFTQKAYTMKRLNKSQRLLVRTREISFYTTAGCIREGVGNRTIFNDVVSIALDQLETLRDTDGLKPLGLSGNWLGHQIQLDLA